MGLDGQSDRTGPPETVSPPDAPAAPPADPEPASSIAPPAARPPDLEGFVDLVDGDRIAGWVRDRASPERRLSVEIRAGAGVDLVRADRDRPDLRAAGKGDGRHGFAAVLDAAALDAPVHVCEAQTGWELAGSPVRFDLPHLLAGPVHQSLLERLRTEAHRALLALEGGAQ